MDRCPGDHQVICIWVVCCTWLPSNQMEKPVPRGSRLRATARGACAVWGQWGAEAWPGAPPAPCTAVVSSGPAGGHGAFARSLLTRPVQLHVFHLLPGRYFSKCVPGSKLKNVWCSFGKSWDIGSQPGSLIAGLLRAFKMVITCWAVSPLPRLPLQLGREGDYWCVSRVLLKVTSPTLFFTVTLAWLLHSCHLWVPVSSLSAACVE